MIKIIQGFKIKKIISQEIKANISKKCINTIRASRLEHKKNVSLKVLLISHLSVLSLLFN